MVIIKVVVAAFLVFWGSAMLGVSPRNAIGEVIAMTLFVTVPYLYLLPSIEASQRQRPNLQSIALLNLLLGWTLLGWVVALVWALQDSKPVVAVLQAVPEPVGDTRTCPHCAETVKAAARVCKHCHGELTPSVAVSTPATPVTVSSAVEVPEAYQATMVHYGITHDGNKYYFGEYGYDQLADAINYARLKNV